MSAQPKKTAAKLNGSAGSPKIEGVTRTRKIDLIKRLLGLKHKLKVYDSMKLPESHEELSVVLLARWEIEDEVKAIEGALADVRDRNVADKRRAIDDGQPLKKLAAEVESDESAPSRAH